MKAQCRLAGQEAPGVPNNREIWTLSQALSPETSLGTCRKISVHAASAPVEGHSSHAGGGKRLLPRPSVLSPSREQKLYWWGKGNNIVTLRELVKTHWSWGEGQVKKPYYWDWTWEHPKTQGHGVFLVLRINQRWDDPNWERLLWKLCS